MTTYYLENIDDVVDLLFTRPKGKMELLIGIDETTEGDFKLLFLSVALQSPFPSLATWVANKMLAGEINVQFCEKQIQSSKKDSLQ